MFNTVRRLHDKILSFRRLTHRLGRAMSHNGDQQSLEEDFEKVEIRVGQIIRC